MKYIIGIGTNLGNRKENIDNAVKALSLVDKTQVLRVSKIYETSPVGYSEQDNFYNCCVEIESWLGPNEMLGACLGIEAAFGRIRQFQNGPRIIDLDIIMAENCAMNAPNLTLPHPRFHERLFVLVPLLELFPAGSVYGMYFAHCIPVITGQEIKEVQ